MFNNSRILIFLIIASLSLGSYILFSLNKVDTQNEGNVNLKFANSKLNIEEIEKGYDQNLNKLIEEIKNYINSAQDNKNSLNLKNLRNEILSLKSPDNKYKNIHLNLILALYIRN